MKGRDLLDQVFDHLSIVEKDYFGLYYRDDSNKTVSTQEHIDMCNRCGEIVIIIIMSVFIVMSSWLGYYECSLGSFDECRLRAMWSPPLRPSQ